MNDLRAVLETELGNLHDVLVNQSLNVETKTWARDKIDQIYKLLLTTQVVVRDPVVEMNAKKLDDVLEVCKGHEEQMWSSKIIGIILDCDFRDAKAMLAKRNWG